MSRRSLGARTLAIPTPVWVIGSYDADGKANAMTASWAGVCCSKPPAVAVSLRKATHTYAALQERKAFTVSVPSVDHAKEADFFGKATGREVDKFAATGLTAVKSELVDAPYVGEFPLILECRVIHDLVIGLHTLFVGEILDVKADESVLGEQGVPSIEKVRPLVFSPDSRVYHSIGDFVGRAFAMGDEITP